MMFPTFVFVMVGSAKPKVGDCPLDRAADVVAQGRVTGPPKWRSVQSQCELPTTPAFTRSYLALALTCLSTELWLSNLLPQNGTEHLNFSAAMRSHLLRMSNFRGLTGHSRLFVVLNSHLAPGLSYMLWWEQGQPGALVSRIPPPVLRPV